MCFVERFQPECVYTHSHLAVCITHFRACSKSCYNFFCHLLNLLLNYIHGSLPITCTHGSYIPHGKQRASEDMLVYSVVDKSKKKKNRASESSTIVSWCGFQYSIEVIQTLWWIHAGGEGWWLQPPVSLI